MCLDANTGKVIWEDRFNVYLTNIPNSRVGWANILVDPETSYVYAHGVGGVFRCYDRDGKIIYHNPDVKPRDLAGYRAIQEAFGIEPANG